MSREWRFYLDDMIEFFEIVMEYTEDYSQSFFGYMGLDSSSRANRMANT